MVRRRIFVLTFLLALPWTARAQTDHPPDGPLRGPEAEIEGARRLFAEGFADENAGRCTDALEKYRRVQAVKDTPNVRFRIGSCSETSGQLRAAMRSYDGAIRLGRGDPQAKDVVQEAEKRIDALTPKMGRLRVARPEGATVRVDNEPVSDAELAEPLWVEPGMHVVTATAPGQKPFHADVPVKEQTNAFVDVKLESDVPAPPPPPPPDSNVRPIVGWSLVGLGTALGAGAVISIVLRETAISSIADACRNGCPIARQAELQSTRERALVAGPLAAVFTGVGGAAIVTGALLLLMSPKKSMAILPLVGPSLAGVALGGTF